MKIVRLIESFYPYMSGPANQAFMISHLLEKNGVKSPIFTTNYNAKDAPYTEVFDNVNVKRYDSDKKFMRYIITKDLKKDILNEKPDLIHAHNFRNYQLAAGFWASRKLNIPFIFNAHGSIAGYKTITKGYAHLPYRLYDIIEGNKIINKADAIIVSSNQEKEEILQHGVKNSNIHIIPMGIDVNEYDKFNRTRDDDKIRLLFVGRICRDRNLMPILKALKSLEKTPEYDRIEFKIIGGAVKRSTTEKDGYLEEIKDYVSTNKLNVEFAGPKYKDTLKQEYRDADIFIYTSLWENFGQTLLEAGASGLPIISTKVGVALDLIKEGDTGYFVPFDEPEEIANSIKKLLKKDKRKMFGENVKQKIKENYSWKCVLEKYENLYSSLLNKTKLYKE